jgi:pro-sigmaK processing inhibitor BofA
MLISVVFLKPVKLVLRLIVRGCITTALVLVANTVLSPMGIAVGINAFTTTVCAILGIPGAAMLFGWGWIFERFF